MKIVSGLDRHFALGFVSLFFLTAALRADPVVSNVRASQRAGTKLVDILYDVTADNALTISATVSTNAGLTYDLPAASFSGTGYGSGVTPGTNKTIVWDAGADFSGQYSAVMRVKVTADDGSQQVLPPDPASVANSPSNGVVSLIYDNVAFLFTGDNAIQTGVSAGAIESLRVAVLRGTVLNSSNAPLSGVTVTVNNHPELGQTLTRTNGAYDLAVNGGGWVSLNFAKTDYLSGQRTLDVPWQDYVPVDDLVMMPADDTVNVVTLPTNLWQAAVGTVVNDLDGARRAVVLYPPDTRAWVYTSSDGATQEVSALTTRFTEYTVGTNGASAMPGDLPPMVAYTYCIALSADEAQIKVAGRDVLFSSNVFFYVDNFLGMPAGTAVPMGYYDESQAAWVPTQDGLVIQLLGTNAAGLARLSVSTNGAEADAGALAALGITDGERQQLAVTYTPCTNSLWRTPILHFSNRDLNYGFAAEAGNTPPNTPKPSTGNVNDPNGEGDYGRLDLENQVFQETIPVAGTPFRLHYSSARVPGSQGNSTITIQLTGATISPVLQRVHLRISVAGQRDYPNTFAPAANLSYTFNWNGLDAYHRSLLGTMPATVRIGYEYRSFYALPTYMAASFGFPSGTRLPSNIIARDPMILWQEHQIPLPTYSRSNGLGWWMLSEHHTYDPAGKILHLGNGVDRDAKASRVLIIDTFAGTGASGDSGNGGPATNALVSNPSGIAVAPNGDVYFYTASAGHRQIRRVAATNGYIYNAVGRPGSSGPWDGEGGPATNALLSNVYGLTFGPDSSLYICDRGNARVLRVDTNGIIRTVAGNGTSGYSGDGGPATNAAMKAPMDVAVAADGTMYISDINDYRIRRVGPDGIISTLAGNGTAGFSGDGGPATNATFNYIWSLKLGPDGALFVADRSNVRVRRIGTDGIINTVAGNGTSGFSGDGGAATSAQISLLNDLAVGSDGTLYLMANDRIREVTSDGIIRTIAGTGNTTAPVVNNSPATAADIIYQYQGLAAALDGSIYVSDDGHNMVRRITRNMPGVSMTDQLIADEDGNRFYQFDWRGRHLKTYHAWTGAALFEFAYTNGYLASVTDGDGNVTRVVRNAAGTPQEIVSPDDQHTLLTLNANGFLSAVQNPAGETIQFGYTTNGLLTSVQGAKGASYTYTVAYNSTGQVVSASDPAGGSTSLRRNGVSNGYEVASTSALGRARTARVEFLPAGDLRRTLVLADGTTQEQWEVTNGTQTNRYPSGTTVRWTEQPDPRFGMQAPVRTGLVVRLTSGLAMTTAVSKVVGLTNQSWTSVASLTNTLTVNGRNWTASYSAANRQIQIASPLGRTYQIGLDSQGRRLWTQRPEIALVSNTFDGRGRLTGIRYGEGADARQFTLTYDAAGYPGTLSDPLGRSLQFINDAIGWVTNMVRPDTQSVSFAYDTHGNRTSLTPPGRAAHSFAYDTVDQLASYTAPAVAGVTNLTATYTYNADRQRVAILRPDGKGITNLFNSAGQLTSQNTDAGTYGFTWSNGLVRTITAPNGPTLNFGYNGFLITTMRWSGVITGQVIYAYNTDFFMRSLTVNSTIVTNGFDADGLLTNAGLCRLQRSAANGLLTGITLGNIAQTFVYNTFAELTNLAVNYAGGSNLFTETLSYDKAGRITSRVEIIQNTTNTFKYEYDALSRLTGVVTNGTGTNIYRYDLNGNRTNWVTSAGAFTATNDGQDRLIQWAGPAITSQYTYSQAGDLTNRVVNITNVTAYSYDVGGNLRQAILPGGITNDYIIDGLGRRVGKKVNGVFTNGWLYLNWLKPVAELDASSNMVSVFVYGSRATVPDYLVKTGVTYRIIADHLGSVRLVVREDTGDIAQRLDYDEWGRVLFDSNPGFQPFGFAGGLYDPDTDLVRFGVRDYDGEIGRWTLKDPILFNGGDANLFAYVSNDPINFNDVTGSGPGGKKQVTIIIPGNGSVLAVKRGGRSKTLREGERGTITLVQSRLLRQGDKLITGPDGRVRINIQNGPGYEIGPNTVVGFDEEPANPFLDVGEFFRSHFSPENIREVLSGEGRFETEDSGATIGGRG